MGILKKAGNWIRRKFNDSVDRYNEKQRRRRAALYDDYYRYEAQCYEEIYRMHMERDEIISNLRYGYENKIADMKAREIAIKKEANRELYKKVKLALEEEENDVKELIEELDSIIENINGTYKIQQNTYLRKKSIDKLKSEIIDTKNKYYGYLWYLSQYKRRRLDFIFERKGEIAEPYEINIPDTVLYKGKLLCIKKSELCKEGSLKINESMASEYICNDLECVESFGEDANVYVLVVGRDGYKHEISCSKGAFKYMAIKQPTIGVEAMVTGYRDNDVVLDYYGLELLLSKKELDNPRRIPPRGAKIRVYALWYKNDLSASPRVTEKYEKSMNWAEFGKIPLSINIEDLPIFKEFVEKNDIATIQYGWKISPINDECSILKLQLGSEHVLKCAVYNRGDGFEYLVFMEVMDKGNLISVEDIFVEVDVTVNVFCENEFYSINNVVTNEMREEFDSFLLYIRNEFSEQKSIQESLQGISYYNKWAELTGTLIEELSMGRPIRCDIVDVEPIGIDYKTGELRTKLYIINNEDVLDQIENINNKNYRIEYFIILNKVKYVIEFSSDASYLIVYGRVDENLLYEDCNILNVYPKVLPYPEMMQRTALNMFREGRIANSKLKPYLLDSGNIVSNDNGDRVEFFFNSYIEANKSQKLAVERALKEENIFLIQGPPGTGKTTVIKEIIQQHLYRYPNDKILIVSQANVAVDNVIRGLLDSNVTLISKENIVRCGNEGSISDDIKHIIFENKKEEYLNKVRDKVFNDREKDKYRKQWIEILENPNEETLVGECILKNHQLIGATCVGLEKKKLGLNEIIFDLVIVDEAGKALPGEILIPINRAKKVILIGDHKQLPPVVSPLLYNNERIDTSAILEDEKKDDFLNESFFKRLYEKCPESNKVMLNTQFRMPSAIGTMVSELFYSSKEEKLLNGDNTYEKKSIIFNRNLNMIDMSNIKQYKEKRDINSGPYNLMECSVVVNLIKFIRKKGYTDRIVVITPYKNQKRYLMNSVKEADLYNVDINTIDAFQGDEAEIVIYCTTRSNQKTDYFSYSSRLNVALSRAKNELIIVGSMKYFKSYGKGSNLYEIGEYISQNGNIFNYNEMKEINYIKSSINKFNLQEENNKQVHNSDSVDQIEVAVSLSLEKFMIPISEIEIPIQLVATPPKRFKIDRAIKYYLENGEMTKPIEVEQLDKHKFMLKDGYARFKAAEELELENVEILVV